MAFASWNIRTLNSQKDSEEKKTTTINDMLRELDVDVAALQETRWLQSGCVDEKDYTIRWKGRADKQVHGVGFAFKRKLQDQITFLGDGSERLLTLRLHTSEGFVTLISAYAPTEVSPKEDKDLFYEQLVSLVKTIPPHEPVILMGDFNARVGVDYRSCPRIVGENKFGVLMKETNDNGERLLEFCKKFDLCITNTFFQNEFEETVTWKCASTEDWLQIDYIMVRRSFLDDKKVLDSRSYDKTDCGTDHNMVICKVRLKL